MTRVAKKETPTDLYTRSACYYVKPMSAILLSPTVHNRGQRAIYVQ